MVGSTCCGRVGWEGLSRCGDGLRACCHVLGARLSSPCQCDVLVEEYEDVIEDWYRHHQTEDLSQFLCADRVLKGKDASKSSEGAAWGGACLWGHRESSKGTGGPACPSGPSLPPAQAA